MSGRPTAEQRTALALRNRVIRAMAEGLGVEDMAVKRIASEDFARAVIQQLRDEGRLPMLYRMWGKGIGWGAEKWQART